MPYTPYDDEFLGCSTPNWFTALAFHLVLAVITVCYTDYARHPTELARETLITTSEALDQNQRPWLGHYDKKILASKNPGQPLWECREPIFRRTVQSGVHHPKHR